MWVTFCGIAPFIQSAVHYHLKNNLGNEFEHFKNCDTAGKYFILGTELWGNEELQ